MKSHSIKSFIQLFRSQQVKSKLNQGFVQLAIGTIIFLITMGLLESVFYFSSPVRLITAEYLKVARGIRCDADQIIVVAGSQQALTIATRVLLNEGDEVWMEDPGYPGAHAAFRGAGARVLPKPVDTQGLDIDHGVLRGDDAKLVYATPSHQYPLGVTMTLSRRLELLDWSRRSNAWILSLIHI